MKIETNQHVFSLFQDLQVGIETNQHVFSMFQDLQVEIETNQHVFSSLAATGIQVTKPSDKTVQSGNLQKRIDDMNERWQQLKSKSVEIR